MRFTHLHTHSHYSLLDGLAKIDALVARAKELGMDSLALTDHGNLYGAVEFYKKATAAGVKPILGVEAYIAPKDHREKTPGADERYHHLILLAENETGWKNLLKLTTIAHLDGFYYKPRMDKALLRAHHEGLIALSACVAGEVARHLMAARYEEAKRAALEYQEIFGAGNFFLEIGHHPGVKDTIKPMAELRRLSKETGIPLVATQDIHYLRKEDAETHDILLAVQTGNKLDDDDRLTLKDDDFSMRSPDDMVALFADVPEAIANTAAIAARCNVKLQLNTIRLPKFPVPEGGDARIFLRKLVDERIGGRYPEITPAVSDRVQFELSVIEKMGFPDYFLIVQDFINWAKERGIVVGPGRGSAAGSIVSYILSITDVDPLKYDLLFERFLNPDRIQMPDIDVDITDRRRDEVFGYLQEKYGMDHVAHIITFGTMAARAAVRDVGRALGVSYGFCDQLAKLIPMSEGLLDSLKNVKELKEFYEKHPDAKRIIDAAKQMEGIARHASVHACGTVISESPLTNYLPLQRAPQDEHVILTQFEMHSVEDLGLLKMDLLGLKNLTIIEDTVRLINASRPEAGELFDIHRVPLDDAKTFELLKAAETTGIFQLECLSGDTIVSNKTIKKLYEDKDKQHLHSVYLDKGKVHKNKIINVLRSGKKEVFTLIAENNWYIKATKNHNFMTENGWRPLSEIKPGDRILMKLRAKHLIFNLCKTCGAQINGQKDAESGFCYKCSAKFYRNPSKEKSREKIREARIKFYNNGGKPWNFGITTATNDKWKKTAEKISKALYGKSLVERWGGERAAAYKKMLSAKFSGKGNPMFGKQPPHRHGGIRDDLGHYVRSNWEADFARILKLHNVAYEYEPTTFELIAANGKVSNYTPDFYVGSTNTFYEVKGWMHALDEEKIRLFQQQYPQYNFVLINTTRFAELSLKYKNLIKWECPRIPVERSFQFVPVKKITYAGEEETYDISMQSPGNNFIANGFMVHNSSGMRRYLKELKPTSIEDITAMVSLYRPGPMDLIPSYIARKHGKETITYLHPKLEPILGRTYGVGIYQEQMMRIARDLAGYTLSEADTLRKAIGKKIKKLLDEQQTKLVGGMIKNGIPEKTANEIWELFPPFARYGFNRSHGVCYAMIGYQTAYLRAHYPVEFFTSLLNADSGDIERMAFLIAESKRAGHEILPPDINKSSAAFTPDGTNIRFGLAAIKNVGTHIVDAIIEERNMKGEFKTLADLLSRVQHKDLNKKSLESMVKCGAVDGLGIERGTILGNIDEIIKFAGAIKRYGKESANGLFTPTFSTNALRIKAFPPTAMKEKLLWEKELLGLYVSEHPLNLHKAKLAEVRARTIGEAAKEQSELMYFPLGGVVTRVQKIVTKKGAPMLFATVEDFTQAIEVIVFPEAYGRTMNVWKENNAVLLMGRMNWKNGEAKFVCEQAQEL